MLLYSLSVSGLLTLLFTLPPLTLDFLMHTHHSSCAPLSEICTGRTAWAAVRDGVPVPEGGGRTHLRVWGCYHGRGCSQDCPANHQAAGQHELGGCWLLHQQAPGNRESESNSVVLLCNIVSVMFTIKRRWATWSDGSVQSFSPLKWSWKWSLKHSRWLIFICELRAKKGH